MKEEIKCPACWEMLSVDNNANTATCPNCGKSLVRKFYYDVQNTKVSTWFATVTIKASDYASTPKERVIVERNELKERTEKLSAFIGGEKIQLVERGNALSAIATSCAYGKLFAGAERKTCDLGRLKSEVRLWNTNIKRAD